MCTQYLLLLSYYCAAEGMRRTSRAPAHTKNPLSRPCIDVCRHRIYVTTNKYEYRSNLGFSGKSKVSPTGVGKSVRISDFYHLISVKPKIRLDTRGAQLRNQM